MSRRDNWCPVVIRGHVQEYRYVLHRDEPGAPEKACLRIENKHVELFEFSGHQFRVPQHWEMPEKYHQGLNRLTGMLRGHSRAEDLPRELEDGWIDFDEFASAILAHMPVLRSISVNDIIIMAANDSKDRFEFRGIARHPITRPKGVNFWPFQIRAAQGHARQVIDDRNQYRNATVIYASERSADIHHAAFAGKPVITDPEKWPKAVFHRTYAASWQSIAQVGLKIAGVRSMDPRAKAHLYMTERIASERRSLPGWPAQAVPN